MTDNMILPFVHKDGSAEFTCVKCGQHIVEVVHMPGRPAICAICIHLPGWQDDPQLKEIFSAGASLTLCVSAFKAFPQAGE